MVNCDSIFYSALFIYEYHYLIYACTIHIREHLVAAIQLLALIYGTSYKLFTIESD